MDCERFDDEVRPRKMEKKIVLSDGRELSHKFVFEKLLESGIKESYMKEALYRILVENPLVVEISDRDVGRTIDIEQFFKRKEHNSRESYEEIKIELDGISSEDPAFYNVLVSHGECIMLK